MTPSPGTSFSPKVSPSAKCSTSQTIFSESSFTPSLKSDFKVRMFAISSGVFAPKTGLFDSRNLLMFAVTAAIFLGPPNRLLVNVGFDLQGLSISPCHWKECYHSLTCRKVKIQEVFTLARFETRAHKYPAFAPRQGGRYSFCTCREKPSAKAGVSDATLVSRQEKDGCQSPSSTFTCVLQLNLTRRL